jgi:hypothetical protein
MPEHVTILQLLGVTALALATVIWVAVLVRILRRDLPLHRGEFAQATGRRRAALRGLPYQRRDIAPHVENVELSPAERDAFALLVRQLGNGRS